MLSQFRVHAQSILAAICRFLQSGAHRTLFLVGTQRLQEVEQSKVQPSDPAQFQAGPPNTESSAPAILRQYFPQDPYVKMGVIGIGMTGLVCQIDENRVVKKPKTYPLEGLSEPERRTTETVHEMHQETLIKEIAIYERLGRHTGIIRCFCTSEYGIELALAKQGNLEEYIKTNPQPTDVVKIDWVLSLAETLAYVHSRRVFVDEIALRNILVNENELKLADFGQSILLPTTADVNTICENELTAQIELLHLGWIFYAIAVWHPHRYYYFDFDDPQESIQPETDGLFCGNIIKKCWQGDYPSMEALKEEAYLLLRC